MSKEGRKDAEGRREGREGEREEGRKERKEKKKKGKRPVSSGEPQLTCRDVPSWRYSMRGYENAYMHMCAQDYRMLFTVKKGNLQLYQMKNICPLNHYRNCSVPFL